MFFIIHQKEKETPKIVIKVNKLAKTFFNNISRGEYLQ